jgi:hypothetical protein
MYQSSDTNSLGKEVDYQGSRQIDNFSRRYYEKELGAGIAPSPGFSEMFGYTEPFRRFVQHETFTPQANEIPNTAASWLPGDDFCRLIHSVEAGLDYRAGIWFRPPPSLTIIEVMMSCYFMPDR